jgi:hypothetical protein
MLNPKKSAKYYLKKANYNKAKAKLLVYDRLGYLSKKKPYGLDWLNKAAYYDEVVRLIDKATIIATFN